MEQLYFNTLSVKNQPLSRLERMEIKLSLNAGYSIRKIAKALGRVPSTISREIKRGLRIHRERSKYLSKDPNYPEYIDKLVYYLMLLNSQLKKDNPIGVESTNLTIFILLNLSKIKSLKTSFLLMSLLISLKNNLTLKYVPKLYTIT